MPSRFLRGLAASGLIALGACGGGQERPQISLESRLRLAQAASPPGDVRPRLAVLREAAVRNPNDANILGQLAVLLEQSGSFAEAADTQRALLALERPNERRLLWIGRLLLRAGDAAGAVQAHEEAVRLAPRSPSAHGGLGLAQDMAGNRAAAQAAYQLGLALAPMNWTLRSNFAMSLIASGAPREAMAVLADAELPGNVPAAARHNLALAYAAAGETERAVRLLRTEMAQTEARVMAEELTAFARWLGPPVVAPQVSAAPPPVAAAPPAAPSAPTAPVATASVVVAAAPVPVPVEAAPASSPPPPHAAATGRATPAAPAGGLALPPRERERFFAAPFGFR